jgi:pimeloyl-ACP methyl ester carboxylesterase
VSVRVLERRDGERVAFHQLAGAGPTVVWLGGFASDMSGTKAMALDAWARQAGRAYLRFDYYGHGASSGEFALGTIRRWREDALAVIDELTDGPLVLVGSSMGGWIACLAALVRKTRLAGMVLVAPAADFTRALMEPTLPDAARAALAEHGRWQAPSPYGEGYVISRALLEDGREWSILPGPVAITAPVRILQGGADEEVPWRHALALAEAIEAPDLVFTLVRDGDHRLSRSQDLARLIAAVEELSA